MGDEGIYATTAEIQAAAGANASATSKAEGYTNAYVLLAEGTINAVCRRQFAATAAAFAALPTAGKKILSETAACLAAIMVIQYDMSGFTSRAEAEDMINILRDTALRNLAILRDKKTQQFIMTGVES